MSEKKMYQAPRAEFQAAQAWETIADTCWGAGAALLRFPDSDLLNPPNATEPALGANAATNTTWGSDRRDVNLAGGGCQGGVPTVVQNAMTDWLNDVADKKAWLISQNKPYTDMSAYDEMTELQNYFAGSSAFNSIANTQSEYIDTYTKYVGT